MALLMCERCERASGVFWRLDKDGDVVCPHWAKEK